MFVGLRNPYFDLGPCVLVGEVGAVGATGGVVPTGTATFFVFVPFTVVVLGAGGL